MLPSTISFLDLGGMHAAHHDAIRLATQLALAAWGRYLNASSGVLDIQIEFAELDGGALVVGGPNGGAYFYNGALRENTVIEMTGGGDRNGPKQISLSFSTRRRC